MNDSTSSDNLRQNDVKKAAPKALAYREDTQVSPEETAPFRHLSDDVTVVTAYLNIGSFQKGENGMNFTKRLYHHWMKIFGSIQNPVIAFMEDDADIEYFREIRQHMPDNRTIIIKVDRNDLWAFSLVEPLKDLFQRVDYPKYHPNTVIAEYSCVMHAKYEFMLNSTIQNPFKTKYFSWVDIGIFRKLTDSKEFDPFSLSLPPNFQANQVAYGQANFRNALQNAYTIFKRNMTWVCGCFFIARIDVMEKWVRVYMESVGYYLGIGLANTDQQVIYAMVNEHRSSVDVQVYKGSGEYDYWFYLGYLCRKSGMENKKKGMLYFWRFCQYLYTDISCVYLVVTTIILFEFCRSYRQLHVLIQNAYLNYSLMNKEVNLSNHAISITGYIRFEGTSPPDNNFSN